MRISVTVYALAIVGVCLAVILCDPFAELIGNSLMGLTAVIFNAIFGALDWGFPTLPTSPTGAGVYAVCMAWGLLAAVPFILLYGVTAHIVGADAKDKDVNPFWDFLGEHSFVIGFILVVGVLVGGYFHIASADVMGGVEGASWGDGIFDWIVAFCVNWASIYSWYVLPIILAALVSAFVFLANAPCHGDGECPRRRSLVNGGHHRRRPRLLPAFRHPRFHPFAYLGGRFDRRRLLCACDRRKQNRRSRFRRRENTRPHRFKRRRDHRQMVKPIFRIESKEGGKTGIAQA